MHSGVEMVSVDVLRYDEMYFYSYKAKQNLYTRT